MTRRFYKASGMWGMWFAVLVTVLIAVLTATVVTKAADAASLRNIEAERMSGSGKVYRDGAASNDRARILYKNGAASKQINSSLNRIIVRAKGDPCRGAPRMKVTVDGQSVMSRLVKANKRWASYSASVKVPDGEHNIKVQFINNRKTKKCDRNLRVDKVTFESMGTTSTTTPPSDYAVKPTCDRSLQSLIDAAVSGDVVVAPGGCIYREKVVVNKPITLEAGPGAEIRGSDVWTGWEKNGDYWVKGVIPDFSAGYNVRCTSGTSRCLWPAQVFFDGRPLRQVASNPSSGQFAVTTNRNIMLAEDPSGHTVEVSTRKQWLAGGADNVTVRGFTMKHAASEREFGAITNRHDGNVYYHDNWTIEDNVLSDAHAAIVVLKGKNNKLLRNDISRGGQLGIHGSGQNILLQGNRIHGNNTENFDPFWEAGGVKMASNVSQLTVEGNEIFNNYGAGVWCDIDCSEVVYSNNRAHHNSGPGLFFEIGSGAKIFNNVVWENGWGFPSRGWSSGIVSSSSRNVEIYNNVSAWNASGIAVISQNRSQERWDTVDNVSVHNNTILAKDFLAFAWLQDWDGVMLNSSSNNRGYDNEYWYPTPEKSSITDFAVDLRYRWGESKALNELADFNATPGEENGRYISEAEKDKTILASGIPPSPQPR